MEWRATYHKTVLTSHDWSTIWVLNDLQVEEKFRGCMELIGGPLFYEFIGIYEEIRSF